MSDIDLAKIVADDASEKSAAATAAAALAEQAEQVEDTAEATTAPADEAAETQDGEAEGEQPKPKKSGGGFQKRISELTREKHEALRRAEYAEMLAEKVLSTVDIPKAPAATATDDEPRPEQFIKYEDFVTAKAEYRAEKRVQATMGKYAQEAGRRTAEQTQAVKVETFVEEAKRQGKGIEGFEDALEAVRAEGFPMNQTIGDYLLDAAENKAGLVKYLADNEDEAFRISRLGTVAAVKALATVEARISAKPKPKTSSAPPPPASVSGGAAAQQSIERMPHKDLKELVRTWGRN